MPVILSNEEDYNWNLLKMVQEVQGRGKLKLMVQTDKFLTSITDVNFG